MYRTLQWMAQQRSHGLDLVAGGLAAGASDVLLLAAGAAEELLLLLAAGAADALLLLLAAAAAAALLCTASSGMPSFWRKPGSLTSMYLGLNW